MSPWFTPSLLVLLGLTLWAVTGVVTPMIPLFIWAAVQGLLSYEIEQERKRAR